MPPRRKFKREEIVDIACKIVLEEGFSSLNARRIARELGSSIQPIFHNFSCMEELTDEVIKKAHDKYHELILASKDKEHPYLEKGLAYIRFARDYPEFFKIIFMQESKMDLDEFMKSDVETLENIFSSIIKKFDVSKEDIKNFHIKVWIFTHGLACLIVTKTVNFSDDEVKDLLMNTVQGMFRGYKFQK